MEIGNGKFWLGDCLELMKDITDGSVDMILCDLPYGVTACKWDTVIPLEPLWEQYERIISSNGAIVLTATQPFTSVLVCSNLNLFKYDWVWNKSKATDFLRAKLKPMGGHESVLIYSKGSVANGAKKMMKYFPQNLKEINKTKRNAGAGGEGVNLSPNGFLRNPTYQQKFTNYPNTKLNIQSKAKTVHPTQKPVALFEYLIKTYTSEGETVLDNCAGSGTTAIACENTNRKWLCIEKEPKYYYPAVMRVAGAVR